jgi:hypothetical protein
MSFFEERVSVLVNALVSIIKGYEYSVGWYMSLALEKKLQGFKVDYVIAFLLQHIQMLLEALGSDGYAVFVFIEVMVQEYGHLVLIVDRRFAGVVPGSGKAGLGTGQSQKDSSD